MIGLILLSTAGASMIIDRFLMKRSKITDLRVGDHKVEKGCLRIPFFFNIKYNRLKGATIEYTLRDAQFPTTVIAGGRRTLEHSRAGSNCEYLDVDTDKISTDGIWIVHVKIVHGDSLYNPLYRIFPLDMTVEKRLNIQLERDTYHA
ncbi:lysis protein [Chimaeribacter californicus]|uniref:Lysis protein n=1 Tax=Chimaeribacter californicus TaxID=2060067 RepID=A0A2N5DU31_9GAMM|nr:lysis protein [Chimaeribacter californicus]PLR30290.1 lysis protein [Chimaeribacter californicus]